MKKLHPNSLPIIKNALKLIEKPTSWIHGSLNVSNKTISNIRDICINFTKKESSISGIDTINLEPQNGYYKL